jgi:hypothetical protein
MEQVIQFLASLAPTSMMPCAGIELMSASVYSLTRCWRGSMRKAAYVRSSPIRRRLPYVGGMSLQSRVSASPPAAASPVKSARRRVMSRPMSLSHSHAADLPSEP